MSLALRLVAYAPGTDTRLGVMPRPLSTEMSYIHNGTGALRVKYSGLADGGDLLMRALETGLDIAVEYNWGSGWVEPFDSRFLLIKRGTNQMDPAKAVDIECPSYVWLLTRIRNLNTSAVEGSKSKFAGQRKINNTAGGTIKTFLDERVARGGAQIPITHSLSASTDAAGKAWKSKKVIYYDVGQDVYSILESLAGIDHCDWRMSGRALKLWNPDADSLDVSATVRLQLGVDIEDAPSDESMEAMLGRVLVRGEKVKTTVTSSGPTPWGVWEGFIDEGGIATVAEAKDAANKEIAAASRVRGEYTRSLTLAGPWLPFRDFRPGDWLTGPAVFGPERMRVQQVTIRTDGDRVTGSVILNDRVLAAELARASKLAALSGGVSVISGSGTPGSEDGGPDLRQPDAPANLKVSSMLYIDPFGRHQARLSVSCDPVTTATDGTVLDIAGYELWGQPVEDDVPGVQRRLTASTQPVIDFQPLDPGSVWLISMRALGETAITPGVLCPPVRVELGFDETPPLPPSRPVLTPWLGTIQAAWDGRDESGAMMPTDWALTEVHVSATSGFVPSASTLRGSIGNRAGGTVLLSGDPGVPMVVRLVAVDLTGNRSGPSLEASGTPERVGPGDVAKEVADRLDKAFADSQAAMDELPGLLAGNTKALADAAQAVADASAAVVAAQQAGLAASAAAGTAQTALTSADGKSRTIYSPTVPVGEFRDGDTWFDTAPGHDSRQARWDAMSKTWVPVLFGSAALTQAAADGIAAGVQAALDAAQAVADAQKASTQAASAAGLAGGKADVLIQSATPSADMQKSTTLWIDTTGGLNTPKRWSGTAWVAVTDKAATDAAAAAATAKTTADAANSAAATAQSTADTAKTNAATAQTSATAANTLAASKRRNFTATPTTPYEIGDLWSQSGVIKVCTTSRASGAYTATDWTAQATDDTVAKAASQAGVNLVLNGAGMMGSNFNFSACEFLTDDLPVGAAGAFRKSGNNTAIYTDRAMAIDPARQYWASIWVKNDTPTLQSRIYFGLVPQDAFGNDINPRNYQEQAGTRTTFVQPLNPGDTVMRLASVAKWNNAAGTTTYLRNVTFWNYVDPGGRTWGPGEYSRNVIQDAYADGAVNATANTVTLRAPYSGPVIPAGTYVSNSFDGANYMYAPGIANVLVPGEWTQYKATIPFSGLHTNNQASATDKFPVATARVVGVILPNRPDTGVTGTVAHRFALISLVTEASDYAQALANTALTSANGKTTQRYGAAAPTAATPGFPGDVFWVQSGNTITGQYLCTAGTGTTSGNTWAAQTLTAATISSLDAGAITAGTLAAARIAAGSITSDKLTVATGYITDAMIASAAITGAKIAAATIGTANISAAAITSALIANLAVGTAQIADSAITSAKIQDLAVGTADIANAAITQAKIANLAVGSAQIADAAITTAKIAAAQITAALIAAAAIETAAIKDGAITTAKIGAAQITNALIADATIQAAKIASIDAGTITAGYLAAARIAAKSLTADQVMIGGANMFPDPYLLGGASTFSGVVTVATGGGYSGGNSASIAAGTAQRGAYTPVGLNMPATPGQTYWAGAWVKPAAAAAAGTLSMYLARRLHGSGSNVGTNKIATNAAAVAAGAWVYISGQFTTPVETTWDSVALSLHLEAAYTGAAVFSDIAIRQAASGELIVDGAITAAKIAANAITAAQIAAGTITSAQLAAGSVTASQIAAAAVTAGKIAANAVTATELAANSIVAGKIAANAVTAASIAANAISADKLAAQIVLASTIIAGAPAAAHVELSATGMTGWAYSADAEAAIQTWAMGTAAADFLALTDSKGATKAAIDQDGNARLASATMGALEVDGRTLAEWLDTLPQGVVAWDVNQANSALVGATSTTVMTLRAMLRSGRVYDIETSGLALDLSAVAGSTEARLWASYDGAPATELTYYAFTAASKSVLMPGLKARIDTGGWAAPRQAVFDVRIANSGTTVMLCGLPNRLTTISVEDKGVSVPAAALLRKVAVWRATDSAPHNGSNNAPRADATYLGYANSPLIVGPCTGSTNWSEIIFTDPAISGTTETIAQALTGATIERVELMLESQLTSANLNVIANTQTALANTAPSGTAKACAVVQDACKWFDITSLFTTAHRGIWLTGGTHIHVVSAKHPNLAGRPQLRITYRK